MIKIDFEKTSEDGVWIYRDALYLEDNHTYSDSEIEAFKQSRFERWLAAVTAPPVITDVPVDELPIDSIPVEASSAEDASFVQE